MQAQTLFYTGRFVTKMIGEDLATQAITDVATSIYYLLYGINDINDPHLENILNKIDIKAQLKTIECLINNIDPRLKSHSLETSLFHLHEIIILIREDLKQLSQKYLDHQDKWFRYFRILDIHMEIENLKGHKEILDKRLDMFMKVFQVESIKLSHCPCIEKEKND